MKIRSDFVSNSSTSSFMMIGMWHEKQGLKDFVIKNYPEWLQDYSNLDDVGSYELIDAIENNFSDLTLRKEICDDDGCSICLGLEYYDMKDDETKKQFEERIRKALSEFYKKPIDKVEVCESAGYC